MTLQPLSFAFPLMSDLSRRPPHAVHEEELLTEVRAEIADRRAFYGRLVGTGKMRQEDSDRHIHLLEAVAADLARRAAVAAGAGPLPRGGTPGEGGAGWDAKVRELRRELAIRRKAWPKRVAAPADPLDHATATRRMERLEAVHWLYWIEMFAADDEFAGRACPRPHVVPSDGTPMGPIRAYHWRIWNWEREARAAGDKAARPSMAPFYAALDAGDPDATARWDHHRRCAQSLGLMEPEAQAA